MIEENIILNSILNTVHSAIYIFDLERKTLTYANSQVENLIGYSLSELQDFGVEYTLKLFHPTDLEALSCVVDEMIQNPTQKTFKKDFRLKHKNGEYRWFECYLSPFKYNVDNQLVQILSNAQDITLQKEIEQELFNAKQKVEESEEKLTTFINSIPDIICYKDGKGNWLLANEADLELFSLKGVDYFGKTDLELSNYTADIYKESFKGCMISDEEAWSKRVLSKGIEIIPTVKCETKVYEVYKVPVFHQNGDRKGLAVIGRDISKLHETQEILIKAKEKAEESDRLKSAFLRNISHEVRTPMNAICGFTDLLLKENISKNEQKNFTDIINQSVNQLLSVIENTITIAHIETNQLKINTIEFNPNKLILDIYDEYNLYQNKIKKTHIKLNYTIDANFNTAIKTDYSRLRQVFQILLNNAFKFTDKGVIDFGYKLDENKITFFVSDTGIGIPKDKQKIIFKSFSQADDSISQVFGGIGLGLSIAAGLIKLVGGQIIIQSQQHVGTQISYTLPIDSSIKEINHINIKQPSDTEYTLLIAEDEFFNYKYILALLSEMKLKTLHANNGLEAVEICKQQNIDIVLMDIKMPIMDGFAATNEIRKFNQSLPIIAQTAFSYKHEDCLNAGFTDYITKPFNKMQLTKVISQFVDVK